MCFWLRVIIVEKGEGSGEVGKLSHHPITPKPYHPKTLSPYLLPPEYRLLSHH
ncbi:hypothetical protein BFG60_1381 [Microcystis aeruginosa NIES-98]|nr:hypothetical protein BFG60_1381 [Microcystis aeruginosa NIES-98]